MTLPPCLTRRRAAPRLAVVGFLLLSWVAAATPARAQEEITSVPVDSLALDEPGVTPGEAFLRAVLLPGWGHASIGSWNRAAAYFAVEAATAYGLVRTRLRLSEARDRLALQEEFRRRTLVRDGITRPDSLRLALEDDERLEELRGLVDAREQQQEDWVALGIFLLFLSGADAFVSAHLRDFPTPLELDAAALPDGRMELSVGVKLPRR
jgi:hypothetical protein